MLALILPLLALSAIRYPTFSVIYADETFDSESIPLFEQLYSNYIQHYREGCSALIGEEKEFCLAYVNAFSGVQATNSKDINTALSKVPSTNEFLLIVGDKLTTTINFAYLPKQMLVFLYGNSPVPSSQSSRNIVEEIGEKFKQASLDKSKNAIFRFARTFKSDNKSPKASLPTFSVVGNIQSKVSFLTVIEAELKITNNNLNCHSLFLSQGSKFSSSSYQCKTNFFIADEASQPNIAGSNLVLSNQYGIFFDSDNENNDFQISYKSDRWSVLKKSNTASTYKDTTLYVPYSSYQAFNLITLAYNFDIHLDYNYLTNPKPVNITVTDTVNMAQLPELLADQKVRITSSGNWQTVSIKPIEVITSDLPVEIDRNYQLSYATNEVFDYFNPSSAPLPHQPTPPPSATPYQPTPHVPIKYPKFYVVYADDTFDSESIPLFEQSYSKYIDQIREGCSALTGEEKEFCLAYVDAYLGIKATNSNDINTALSKVPSTNEFLLVVGDKFTTTINFAYLPKQMLVFLYGNNPSTNPQNSKNIVEEIGEKFRQVLLDKSKNAIFRFARTFKSDKKSPKASLSTFPVYGKISSRVSYLTVIEAELKITNSPLDCHSLFLSQGSKFSSNSYQCRTNFFIADEKSQPNVAGSSFVLSNQYGIFFDGDNENNDFQISYKSDRWSVLKKSNTASTYKDTNLYVPYSSYQAFNLITLAFNFDLHLDYNYLTNPKPVNITVTDTVNMAQLPELLADQIVHITSSGNWQNVPAKPVEVITSDYPVEVDPYYQPSFATFEVFDYFSPTSVPFPSQPTAPPSAPSSAPPYTQPTDGGGSGSGSSFGPGKIAGTCVGGAAGVGGIIAAILCCKKNGDGEEGGQRPNELFDNMNP